MNAQSPHALVLLLLLPVGLFSADPKKEPSAPSREEQALIDLVNAERKSAKLPPLKANLKLMQAARDHSAKMAKLEMAAHELEGKTPKDRIEAIGYSFARIGENVAAGQRTPSIVMMAWMESEVHKANILKEEFTEIGVGIVNSENGVRYWTQVFGTPLKKKR